MFSITSQLSPGCESTREAVATIENASLLAYQQESEADQAEAVVNREREHRQTYECQVRELEEEMEAELGRIREQQQRTQRDIESQSLRRIGELQSRIDELRRNLR